jgi:hypothetical protein
MRGGGGAGRERSKETCLLLKDNFTRGRARSRSLDQSGDQGYQGKASSFDVANERKMNARKREGGSTAREGEIALSANGHATDSP